MLRQSGRPARGTDRAGYHLVCLLFDEIKIWVHSFFFFFLYVTLTLRWTVKTMLSIGLLHPTDNVT